VYVGHPLAFELALREPIDELVAVKFCLQRPDGSVLRKQAQFRNAKLVCPGCDPYPGAPPDVCAPEKICQVEYSTPSYQPFDAIETSAPGAYLLSVEAEHGAFDPLTVVIEVAPRP
jgi:hypothetical protein